MKKTCLVFSVLFLYAAAYGQGIGKRISGPYINPATVKTLTSDVAALKVSTITDPVSLSGNNTFTGKNTFKSSTTFENIQVSTADVNTLYVSTIVGKSPIILQTDAVNIAGGAMNVRNTSASKASVYIPISNDRLALAITSSTAHGDNAPSANPRDARYSLAIDSTGWVYPKGGVVWADGTTQVTAPTAGGGGGIQWGGVGFYVPGDAFVTNGIAYSAPIGFGITLTSAVITVTADGKAPVGAGLYADIKYSSCTLTGLVGLPVFRSVFNSTSSLFLANGSSTTVSVDFGQTKYPPDTTFRLDILSIGSTQAGGSPICATIYGKKD